MRAAFGRFRTGHSTLRVNNGPAERRPPSWPFLWLRGHGAQAAHRPLSLNIILNVFWKRLSAMPKYVMVANSPNRNATVHLWNCNHLGPDPIAQFASSERSVFDDGLEALASAKKAMPRVISG